MYVYVCIHLFNLVDYARTHLFFFNFYLFIYFFCLLSFVVVVVVAISWAASAAYGGSQARG